MTLEPCLILRSLGLNAQELEAGPYIFLISHSVPVAYKDRSQGAMWPGIYRTDKKFTKATTRHLNAWLRGSRYSTIPHEKIVEMFQSISRFEQPESERRQGEDRRNATDP